MTTRRQVQDHMRNAIRLNNRGVDAWEAGDFNRAIQLFEQCLAIFELEGLSESYQSVSTNGNDDSSRTDASEVDTTSNYDSLFVFCCPRRFNGTLASSLLNDPAIMVLSSCVLMNFAMVLHVMGGHLCKEQWIMNAKLVYERAMILLDGLAGPDATFMVICAFNNMAALHRHYLEFQESSLYLNSLSVAIQNHISLLFVLLSQKECRDLILNVVLGSSFPSTACAA